MNALSTPRTSTRTAAPYRFLAALSLAALVTTVTASGAHAALTSYVATLSGANESPANPSTGTGFAQVDIDDVAHTMHISVVFSGLLGTTTASHIHCATTVAGAGTAGVATTTPTFAGFPGSVTAGTYDNTLDLTSATSYNPSFVTAHGGTTAGAEAFLVQGIVDGKAYLNIHTSVYAGGEIRGFLTPQATPTSATSWGGVKSLFR